MAFGKFRPVLTPGAELGSDGAGAGSAPMTERFDVTRSDLQRPSSETVISARGLRVSYGDFEALRAIDLRPCGRSILRSVGGGTRHPFGTHTGLQHRWLRSTSAWPRCAALPRSARRRGTSV